MSTINLKHIDHGFNHTAGIIMPPRGVFKSNLKL